MKLSHNKEINNQTLIVILVASAIILSLLGFSFIGILFSLFLVMWVVYLVCPTTEQVGKNKTAPVKDSSNITPTQDVESSEKPALNETQKNNLISRWAKFGRLDAVCPSCNTAIAKFPKRKIKCKACKKTINRGKNYFNGDYFLYADKEEKRYIELLWLSNGTWQNWFDSFDEIRKIKKQLAITYKYKGDVENIPLNDVIWAKIQKQLSVLSQKGDWNNYNNLLESGIRFLNGENNTKAALPLIYQFIYLSYIVDHSYNTEYEDLALFPKRMSTGGMSLLVTMIKETDSFDAEYLNFIQKTALPSVFKIDTREPLSQYKAQRVEFEKQCNMRAQRKTKN